MLLTVRQLAGGMAESATIFQEGKLTVSLVKIIIITLAIVISLLLLGRFLF